MRNADNGVVKLKQPIDFRVLEAMSDGRRDKGANIAIRIDEDRMYVNNRLNDLAEYGLFEKIGPAENTGLYQITPKGVAAMELEDGYERGRKWEEAVEACAQRVEIRDPETVTSDCSDLVEDLD